MYFWINMPILLSLSVCLPGNLWFMFWVACPDSDRKIYSFIFFLLDLGWVLQCEVLHRCQSTRCRKLAQIYQVCWMLQSAQPCCMSDKWSGMWRSLSGLFFVMEIYSVNGKKKPPNNSAICTTDFGLFAVTWQKTGYRCEMQKRVILMMGYRWCKCSGFRCRF